MKRFSTAVLLMLVLLLIGTSIVFAKSAAKPKDPVAIGAQLYDKWYAFLGVGAPSGNMPLWERQSTNTRTGAETWRCSECHGWDYQGKDGAFGAGSHYTGFPSVMALAANMSEDEIVDHLKGGKDPAHDFSPYFGETEMRSLATFLKQGLIDDARYIDSVTLKVIGGDVDHGRQLFDGTCAECHGEEGKKIVFRTEGVDEYLGTVANRDPYRFLHRSRFGVAGTEMPVGMDLGWTAADGRDILLYAQSLPTGVETEGKTNTGENSNPSPQIGGPANNIWTGILTGIGAFFGMFGGAIIFIALSVFVGMIVVLVLRRRK
jgi:thiosulfate dehydrogenase